MEKLNKIQAQNLRECCGAIKITPVLALQVLTGEMLLELRRKQLMVNYWVDLKGQAEQHPAKQLLQKQLGRQGERYR